jgi:hypothetical protein
MSVGAVHLCHSTGRVWFEVEVLKASGYLHVGFAGTSFHGGDVGGDAASWSVANGGCTQHGLPPLPTTHAPLPHNARRPLRASTNPFPRLYLQPGRKSAGS